MFEVTRLTKAVAARPQSKFALRCGVCAGNSVRLITGEREITQAGRPSPVSGWKPDLQWGSRRITRP